VKQKDLFGLEVEITLKEYLDSGAIFSPDKRYRYVLYRKWGTGGKRLNSIGLNPSTADHKNDDPTIHKDVDFARRFGYDELYKLNAHALISSNPRILLSPNTDVVGPENDKYLKSVQGDVLLCWGSWGKLDTGAIQARLNLIKTYFPNAYCLGINKDGEPKHPLYLPSDTKLIRYKEVTKE
jgi:hypothetical protein